MSISLNGISLSPRLQWTDEFAPQVVQTVKHTLDGGSVRFAQAVTQGRPVTLAATRSAGWMRRPEILQLQALADQPNGQWTLDFHGTLYTVAFRHHEPPAFEAQALVPYATPGTDSIYLVTLKLMTVTP